MLEFELARIVIDDNSDHQFIVLKQKNGTRAFPVVIGSVEATAIDRFVKDERTPRPLTHELLNSVIHALGATVARVEITQLKDRAFHANVVLRTADGRSIEVDSRTSDAISLAVRNASRIFVNEDVLEQTASSA